MAGSTLPERVAQFYYTYGLFCSSYPITAITIAVSGVLLCCYPLLNVPLPGTNPTVLTIPNGPHNVTTIYSSSGNAEVDEKDTDGNNVGGLENIFNKTQKLPYMWTKDKPLLYIQQIILKTGVTPWNSNLHMWDAFRAPIQQVFRLLEHIRNHENPEKTATLQHLCYHVENVKRNHNKDKPSVLPEYSCLVLSPANLWHQNLQKFALDSNIVSTVYSHQNLQKGKVSVAEMAFGMKLQEAGVKRYPLRARPRSLQYAVTIFYNQVDERFINSLKEKLVNLYPLHQDTIENENDQISLIYYPGKFNYHELVPLSISFVGLFLYVYFSVRKIEFVQSKFGLASCSVITIVGSLSMSMGLCFFFGFSLSLQGKEIFPYLVILVGLENVLVLTKSVTSTDSRLDVKIRLAQGLSKEGWSITKNLLIEITILTVSLFTFVPVIQEFSIFMIVSLISDFFLQMVFFATILGIDVRRMESFQEQNSRLQLKDYFTTTNALNWRYDTSDISKESPQKMRKSKSHPRLNGLGNNTPTDVVANRQNSPGKNDRKLPKRIRLVNIWARTRFFQRAFMVWMVVWISIIVYNSGIIEHFVDTGNTDNADSETNARTDYMQKQMEQNDATLFEMYNRSESKSSTSKYTSILEVINYENNYTQGNENISLKHTPHNRPWTRLSKYHWSSILSQYNVSVAGRYVAILPPILLSCPVSPEQAVNLRNLDEKDPPPLRWQALAAALDPIDIISDLESAESNKGTPPWSESYTADLPIYPTTPMEILLLAILCGISVVVITYTMVVLYKCVCSRNYAEWRASWAESDEYLKSGRQQPAIQLVMEAVPLVVSGHGHEVECLVTDGQAIVSSCLQGTLKVWDGRNGDLITQVDRYEYFKQQKEVYDKLHKVEKCIPKNSLTDNEVMDVELSKPPSGRDAVAKVPHIKKYLQSNLCKISPMIPHKVEEVDNLPIVEQTKYNFARYYRELCASPEQQNLSTSKADSETKENINITNGQTDAVDTQSSTVQSDTTEVISKSSLTVNSNLRNRNKHKFIISTENSLEYNEVHKSVNDLSVEDVKEATESARWAGSQLAESPIWCMDFCNDLVIVGCADGRLEFWEASTGKLMCVWRDWRTDASGDERGVTRARALGGARRVCAATLSGHLVLLRLDVYNPTSGARVDWRFSTTQRTSHTRSGSTGSIQTPTAYEYSTSGETQLHYRPGTSTPNYLISDDNAEEVRCVRIAAGKPHQQPITEMESEGGRIVTGAQDHILKVFSSVDMSPLFTLHGHCGPITSLFIDRATPTIAGSGSQDGLLCVWDLHTGACLYSIQAHDGAVTALAYTASYVISEGSDERLCVWDRFQGHMLNNVHIGLSYTSKMLPLTDSLLLMGDRSGMTVLDLSSGDIVRRVLLGQNEGCVFVRQILPLKEAVVCDYGNQLRIVRFPLVSELSNPKTD